MSPNTARLTAAAPPTNITTNPAVQAPGLLSHSQAPGCPAHLHLEGPTCVRQWPWSSVMLYCPHTHRPPTHTLLDHSNPFSMQQTSLLSSWD